MATLVGSAAGGSWTTAASWVPAQVPTAADDCVLDATSGALSIVVGSVCRSLNCTSGAGVFSGTLTSANTQLAIGDSTAGAGGVALKLSAAMTYAPSSTGAGFNFVSTSSSTQTVDIANKLTVQSVTFNATGATYSLVGNLDLLSTLNFTSGTMLTNNNLVGCSSVSSTGTAVRSINWGTSTVNLKAVAAGSLINITSATNFTWFGDSANFVIVNASSNSRSISTVGLNLGTFDYTLSGSAGSLTIGNGSSIGKLRFSDTANARNVSLTGPVTINDLNDFRGTPGKLMSIVSNTAGTTRIINKTGTILTSTDYVNIQDITFAAPYTYYFGLNSFNSGNNTNANFTNPTTGPYRRQGSFNALSGTSATVTFDAPALAGSLLIIDWLATAAPGAVTGPVGYTLAVSLGTAPAACIWYKVAVGGETSATVSWVSARSVRMHAAEVSGWTIAPTLDAVESNAGASAVFASTTAATGVANTEVPGYGFALFALNGSGAATGSYTNGWQEDISASSTIGYTAMKPISALAAQSTVHAWTTARVWTTNLVIFKDALPSNNVGMLQMFGM